MLLYCVLLNPMLDITHFRSGRPNPFSLRLTDILRTQSRHTPRLPDQVHKQQNYTVIYLHSTAFAARDFQLRISVALQQSMPIL